MNNLFNQQISYYLHQYNKRRQRIYVWIKANTRFSFQLLQFMRIYTKNFHWNLRLFIPIVNSQEML